MKKKVFSLMMMLLLAVTGYVRAEEVTVHNGMSTSSYIPVWGAYTDNNLQHEFVYPANDLNALIGGQISKLKFYASSLSNTVTWNGSFQIFLKEVGTTTITSFLGTSGATLVYEGSLGIASREMEITFDTPYNYGGGNLWVGVYYTATTGYQTCSWLGEVVSGASIYGRSGSNYAANSANFLPKTTFTYSGGGNQICPVQDGAIVETVYVGARPNGCWMEPFTFQVRNLGTPATITNIDWTPQEYFTLVAPELPVQLARNQEIDVQLTTGSSSNTEWQMVALYGVGRLAALWNIVAEPYDPAIPDVWEKACTQATSFPFVEVPATAHNTTLHNDYTLPFPEIPEGYDAVYKLVFTRDQMLNAEVTFGNDGKVALYREGFEGEGGPMATNNYTGIEMPSGDTPGPGPGPQPDNNATVILTAGDVWGDGSGYQMLLDDTHSLFGTTIPEVGALSTSCSGNEAIYAQFSHKIPTNADGNCATQNIVINNSVSIQIPAGTYDWCITNPTPGDRIWIAGGNGNVGGRQDDFVFEAGKTYEFTCSLYSSGDGVDVTVTGGAKKMYTPLPAGEVKDIANVMPLSSNTRDNVYSAGPIIQGLPVTPGTYYLVASSTTPNFQVTINAMDMPCPLVEDFAFNPQPADNQDGLEPASVTLHWNIPDYTTGWRLIFGSTYYPEPGHPQTIMYPADGSFTRDLANSFTVTNLWNNTNYFWRVEFNNDCCPQGVSSPIWGFTTNLNIPHNLTVVDATVFNDETITLNWNAIVDRTYRNYNVYRDGVLIGSTQEHNISSTTFTDGPLAYNMAGYHYYVTAVYDEGESAPSNEVVVQVSGYGDVNGHVYEQDLETGIANATVTMVGLDEFGVSHTYTFTTNGQGYYTGHIYTGEYNGSAACNGYQTAYAPIQGNPIDITYNNTTTPVDYMLDENFDPVCAVIAEYYPDSLDPNSPYVKVYWGCGLPGSDIIEDFETGDFSMFDWQVDSSYPWSIVTTNPYEGTYCMKSGGAGVDNVVSNMTVTVEIPADGEMSFFGKISSENNWDYGYFFIDGVQKGQYTGAGSWTERTFEITAGEHTFQWRYTKDSSVNSNDDCFYVDYINFYRQPAPQPTGTVFSFDNGLEGWTNIDADGDGHVWYHSSEAGNHSTSAIDSHSGSGHLMGESYCNALGTYGEALTPDNYLVSPQMYPINSHSVISFWACAQDVSYAAEHFGVAISTTSNTNASAFTTIQEWTLSAKGSGKPSSLGRGNRAVTAGEWYNFTCDLSAYAGQEVWIAIRHFNVTDQFIICLDDVLIGEAGKGLANNDRAFLHYRVYRTNCYNDGPYTLLDADHPDGNTVVLACEITDTIYIDVDWPDVAPGVYKWGVGVVYSGNRGEEIAGPITWATPMAVNTPETSLGALAMAVTPDVVNHVGSGNSMNNRDGWLYYDDGVYDNAIGAGGTAFYWGIMFPASDMAAYNGQAVSKVSQYFNAAASGDIEIYQGGTDAPASLVYTQPFSTSTVGEFVEFNLTTPVTINGSQSLWIVMHATNYSDYPASVSTWQGDDNGSWISIDGTEWWDLYSALGGQGDGTWMLRAYVQENGTPGPTPPTPPTPSTVGLQEPRESEIVWSNCLDKDMYLAANEVTVNVLLNSADSPEGAQVTFTNYNEAEQELYPVAPIVLDETGFYAFETFRKGDYKVNVTFDGYEPIEDSVSIWDPTDLRYVMIEIIYPISDLYVSSTGWAMWGAQGIPDGPNPPTPPTPPGSEFSFGFEEELAPNGWTIQTLDPDGTWERVQTVSFSSGDVVPHEGQYQMEVMWDYYDQDEWLITPAFGVPANAMLTFWMYGYMGSTYGDHYYVKVSTDGGSTWTTVWDASTQSGGENHYTSAINIDLGAYAGQTIKLAWNAYAIEGLWYTWFIDDITVSAGRNVISFDGRQWQRQPVTKVVSHTENSLCKAGDRDADRHLEGFKVMCTSIDGVSIYNTNVPATQPFCQLDTENLIPGDHYICKVSAIYSTGVSSWVECEWQYIPCENYAGTLNGVTIEGNVISWDYPNGTGPTPPPTPGDNATVILTAGDVWGDGTGYQMLLDADASAYGTVIPTSGPLSQTCTADYSAFEYKIPTNADANCTTNNIVFNNSISITIPAGTYDWCITNPDPGYQYIWIASDQGNVGGRQDNYVFEAGKTYEFTVSANSSTGNDQTNVTITDGNGKALGFACNVITTSNNRVSENFEAPAASFAGERVGRNFVDGTRDGWLKHYTNTTMDVALGLSGGAGNFFWGVMFPANSYSATSLTKVSYYNNDPFNGEVYIYQGGTSAPGTLVYTQPFSTSAEGMIEINMDAPVAIDATQNLWVVFHNLNGGYVATYTDDYAGVANGSWISTDGAEWYTSVSEATGGAYDGNWLIAAYVTEGTTPTPPPADGSILGAMIFADGEWEAFVPVPTNTYTYEGNAEEVCVRMVYDGTHNLPEGNIYYSMSCPECEPYMPGQTTCEPGAPIHAEQVSEQQIKIWWGEQIVPISEWLYYDNGTYATSVGTGSPMTIYWATMFPAASLVPYAGTNLTKVAVFEFPDTNPVTVTIHLGGTNAPGTAYSTTSFVPTAEADFQEVTVDPVAIDGTQNLWIVCSQLGEHPAHACTDTGDPNNRWISLDGSAWQDLAAAGLSGYAWLIRGFVTNQSKGGMVENVAIELPTPAAPATNTGVLSHTEVVNIPAPMAFMNRANLVRYNVYRSTEATGTYALIGSVNETGATYYEYIDTPANAGTYYYQVRAEYDNDCESEPALAADGSGNNYVSGSTTVGDGLGENNGMAIYPNPTKGNVTIEANGMRHITVVSMLGQVVFDAEVENDTYILNMAQFTAGMYTVRVTTENGVNVSRITVVR